MLNTTLRYCQAVRIRNLIQYQKLNINLSRKLTRLHGITCICSNNYINQRLDLKFIRVHSTQSDHHRQKVVIETSEPKIVLGDEKTFSDVWKTKVDPYLRLARWDKPIGVYLLYWPCTWSIALGSLPGNVPLQTSLYTAGLFLVGAGLMRGAGCTINDLWDKDVDKQVARTKSRPLVSGELTDKQALGFLALQLSLALGVLLHLNCYSVLLGASSMVLVVTYPLAKRFTNYPQLFLGATFNWGALLGYSALQGTIDPLVCLPLYFGALAWTVVYDTIYAIQDKEDDARLGIGSSALAWGARARPALAGALAASALALAGAGLAAGLRPAYLAAVAAYALHAGRQIYTLDINNADEAAKKFKSNTYAGFIILAGILAGGYSQYLGNREKHRGKEDSDTAKSCLFG